MEKYKVAVIGSYFNKSILSGIPEEYLRKIFSKERNIEWRMLLTLADYLTIHSKKFDKVFNIITDEPNGIKANGEFMGILRMLNQSKIDIGIHTQFMNNEITNVVDYAYPYKLDTVTYVTQKAEYEPHIFGILQTFSQPLWIIILSTLLVMSLVYYGIFRRKYSFDKILLHVVAVLFRQCSVLKPSSMINQLLVFSWVAGAMFLCLAYDSVVLSFLSFPPVSQVRDVPQLAKAVKEGHYHCVSAPLTAIGRLLSESRNENLKIIGQDIQKNKLNFEKINDDFYYDRNIENIALISTIEEIDVISAGRKFVSEDRFLESMSAMPVRKDFCCKKLIDNFVHRMMASGLYFKQYNDKTFLERLPGLMKYEGKDTSKRVLNLTDVAPAFIFLMFGHIISFLVLIVEIVSYRMTKKKKIRANIARKEDVNKLAMEI